METVKLGSQAYRKEFLSSPVWIEFRNTILATSPPCSRCGAEGKVDLHHVIYRKDIYDVRASDVLPLCRKCHNLVHRAIRVGILSTTNPRSKNKKRINKEKWRITHLDSKTVSARESYLRTKRSLTQREIDKILNCDYRAQQRIRGLFKVSNFESIENMRFTNRTIDKAISLYKKRDQKYGLEKYKRPKPKSGKKRNKKLSKIRRRKGM